MGLVAIQSSLAHSVASDDWRLRFEGPKPTQEWLFCYGENQNPTKDTAKNSAAPQLANGAIILVQEGQCALLVSEGKICDICAQPGEYIYQSDAPESLLIGKLSQEVKTLQQTTGRSFAQLGQPTEPVYLYYCNLQPIEENLYGTPGAIQYPVEGGMLSLRLHGEYSYIIENPVLFFHNRIGGIAKHYTTAMMEAAIKPDWKNALPHAFAALAVKNVPPNTLAKNTTPLLQEMQALLCEKWRQQGIKLVACSMSEPKLSAEGTALLRSIAQPSQITKPTPPQPQWTCSCGRENNSKFCTKCGEPQLISKTYHCTKCGNTMQTPNETLEFCGDCGAKF